MSDVFISYSRKDQDFVRTLHGRLAADGRDVWIDWEDIPFSAEWMAEVTNAIRGADNFVFVISEHSLASRICLEELARAEESQKRLVPIVRQDPDELPMPASIGARNWVFIRPEDDFDQAFSSLLAALDTDLDWVRAHTRLLLRTREWIDRDRNSASLLRGAELEDAEQWLAKQIRGEPQATPDQAQYVLSSRRAASRRQRGAVTTAVAITAVMVLLTTYAFVQRGIAITQRNTAVSRQLATESRDTVGDDPERGLKLALQAWDTRETNEAKQAVRTALQRSTLRGRLRLPPPLDDVFQSMSVGGNAFTRDGKLAVVAGDDGIARIWDWQHPERKTRDLQTDDGQLDFAEFSPDATLVLTEGSGTVRIWDREDGTSRVLMRRPRTDPRASFSPGGRFVAAEFESDAIRVWDASSGRVVTTLKTADYLPRWSWTGPNWITAFTDKRIEVFDVRTETVETFDGPSLNGVSDVVFSPDGTLFALSRRYWVELYRSKDPTHTFREYSPRPLPTDFAIHRLRFSPDSRWIAASAAEGAYIWSVVDDRLVELPAPATGVSGMAFSPDGRWLITGGERAAEVRDWMAAHARLLNLSAIDAQVSPDGRTIVALTEDSRVALADVRTLATHTLLWEPKGLSVMAWSTDGRYLALGGGYGSITVVDVRSEKVIARSPSLPAKSEVLSVAFSGDGSKIAFLRRDSTTTAGMWQWRTSDGPALLQSSQNPGAGYQGPVSFSKDGEQIRFSVPRDRVVAWDGITGHEPSTLGTYERKGKTYSILNSTINADGKTVASIGTTGERDIFDVRIWDLDSGQDLRVIPHAQLNPASLRWTRDGRMLAVSGWIGDAWLIDPKTKDPPVDLPKFGGLAAAPSNAERRPPSIHLASGLVVRASLTNGLLINPCAQCVPFDDALRLVRKYASSVAAN